MYKTVKDAIHYLEKLNPNDPIACWIFTKHDIKQMKNYASGYPYTDDLAKDVVHQLEDYDIIDHTIQDSIISEISSQVHHLHDHNENASF